MTSSHSIQTSRLRVAYRRAGEGNARRLLFIHGNLSSSVYVAPLMPLLAEHFDVVAPDLRCFGETEAADVDATRGYRDFSDDIHAFVEALGWERFELVGWSMGGNIAMQYAIDHAERVERLVLLAPGSPYGFGGTYGAEGTPFSPLGLGSGAGTANPGLVLAVEHGSRFILRDILRSYYFAPPFRMGRDWENRMLDALGKISTGAARFPGTFERSDAWPHVVAGDVGVLNAMSSKHGRLEGFLELAGRLDVLWVHGDADRIVSDESLMDVGYLGKIGLMPGWPGEDVYPPQPMEAQIRAFLGRYRARGGTAEEVVIPGGHMCALESPAAFLAALL